MKRLLKIVIITFLYIGLVTILNSCKKTTLPELTTTKVTDITAISAVSGGNVTSNGGAEVTARGVCWSTKEKPTINSNPNKTSDGTGNGSFSSTITGLMANTKYYVCAYATNNEGTEYGNQVEFTTFENPPVADFTASPTTIAAGQSVQFTDQSSNNPTSWSWNFGDGTKSTSQSPSHAYSAAGTYTISLTATNISGSNTEIKTNYITVVAKPEAAFTASPTTITAGQSIQFTDQSTNAPTSWTWNFGDGGTSTSKSPSHTYSTVGTFTVSLTATNIAGSDTETKTNFIKVNPIVKATITTNAVTSITSTTAVSGGNISSNGGGTITQKGVCWDTSVNPTTEDNKTANGTGTGSFTSNLTGLTDGTTYYVCAYATNEAGTAYGEQFSFITPVSDVEGNVYMTVKIGTQVWMAENLKATAFNDHTNIPNIQDFTEWANADSPAYCWYGNQSFYKEIYGAIYNWYTVNTGKICPVGWHVPYIEEWDTLNKYVDSDARKLREPGYNHWTCQEPGTNETGFTALPGGLRYSNDYYQNTSGFNLINKEIWFWSASIPQGSPQSFFIYCSGTQSAHNDSYQDGRYIRCLKN